MSLLRAHFAAPVHVPQLVLGAASSVQPELRDDFVLFAFHVVPVQVDVLPGFVIPLRRHVTTLARGRRPSLGGRGPSLGPSGGRSDVRSVRVPVNGEYGKVLGSNN